MTEEAEAKGDSPPATLQTWIQQASERNPSLKQAEAEIAAARGAAVQAGRYPNPRFGYQGDQIGSGNTAGQQGAFFNQTIVTRGKLGLAQAAALAEVVRAEAAFQQAKAELTGQVQVRYYAMIVAAEGVRIADEMARKVEALGERQRKLADSGQPVAPNEIAQAKALVSTARNETVQARNRLAAARKQWNALVGGSEGSVELSKGMEVPLPHLSYESMKSQLLADHSEIRAAGAQLERNRLQLELARVTPIPNVETNTYVQQDYQTRTPQFGVQIGVVLPVYDRNQGNIAQAEANLVRATHENDRVRLELTQRLTDAFEKYATNRESLERYTTQILPEQIKAADLLAKRFEQEPGKVSFSEVILSQQSLSMTHANYLAVLGAAWQAAAELTRLTQRELPASLPSDIPSDFSDATPKR